MPVFVCVKCGHFGNTAASRCIASNDFRCHRCIIEDGDAIALEIKLWGDLPRFDKAPDETPKGEIVW